MNRRRTLSLKRETLAELASSELSTVAGGATGPTCHTCLTLCDACEVTGVICPAWTLAAFRCPGIPSVHVVCS